MSFPLLSDPDSEIIKRFGILNTLTDPDDHPWYGIPFPGTYVIDADGIIIEKFFESSFMLRPSADQLLRAALGKKVDLAAPTQPRHVEEVTYTVNFDGTVLNAGVVRDLVVELRVPEGYHLYGNPVPEGMVATSVEVDEQVGLVVEAAQLPATAPYTLAGTGETLQVFDGDVEIRVPIAHMSRPLTTNDEGAATLTITGTVRWQSCDADACQLPQRETFTLHVPAARHNTPGHWTSEGSNFKEHFSKMLARQTGQT